MRLPVLSAPLVRNQFHIPCAPLQGVGPSTGRCRGCFGGLTADMDCSIYGTGKVNEQAPGFEHGFVCTNDNSAQGVWNCAAGETACVTPDSTGTYPCF